MLVQPELSNFLQSPVCLYISRKHLGIPTFARRPRSGWAVATMAFRPALSPRNVQRCLALRRGRPYSSVERWNDVPYKPSPLFPAAWAPDGWSRHDDVSTARSSLSTPAIQALLVDAAGTLLVPSEPSAKASDSSCLCGVWRIWRLRASPMRT